MSAEGNGWREANQRHLVAALAVVREALDRHLARMQPAGPGARAPVSEPSTAVRALGQAELGLREPAALQTLCEAFGLSAFERDVVLLCAGVELESGFSARCAAAAADPQRGFPTFSLALAALPEAHWSALSPNGPLRRFRLVNVEPGPCLTLSRLRIDERVLHFLTGLTVLDERLQGMLEPVAVPEHRLVPSHREVADAMSAVWARPQENALRPVLMLCGPDEGAKAAVAAACASSLGLRLHALRASDLPILAADREAFCRVWERESVLSGSALLLEVDDGDGAESARAASALMERMGGLLVVSARDPLRARRRTVVRFDLPRPPVHEQEALWRGALGSLAGRLNGELKTVVSQFSLGLPAIQAVSADLRQRADDEDAPLGPVLWDACRAQARPRLEDLAQRVEAAAGWGDLVLPAQQMELLRALAAHVRQRARVYEEWGFSKKGARGLGISALFSGNSGTGKTMAAEVLAQELALDLYRIDLSQVVSKYIGETEKNLRRIFDAAEEGGALLLFDEADALFGKRSEVKDSHDRYANLEVSYLLQRMEAYRGLAILTTNMRSALDSAFLRRLRFIVEFPFPDAEQRAEIWRKIFPSGTPTEKLEPAKLARLNVAGGVIRSIALNAAFLAADRGEPVRMGHLAQAARAEYLKLEKPLSDAEIGGWA